MADQPTAEPSVLQPSDSDDDDSDFVGGSCSLKLPPATITAPKVRPQLRSRKIDIQPPEMLHYSSKKQGVAAEHREEDQPRLTQTQYLQIEKIVSETVSSTFNKVITWISLSPQQRANIANTLTSQTDIELLEMMGDISEDEFRLCAQKWLAAQEEEEGPAARALPTKHSPVSFKRKRSDRCSSVPFRSVQTPVRYDETPIAFSSRNQTGKTGSQTKRKGSTSQQDENPLDSQIKGYSGPNLPEIKSSHNMSKGEKRKRSTTFTTMKLRRSPRFAGRLDGHKPASVLPKKTVTRGKSKSKKVKP